MSQKPDQTPARSLLAKFLFIIFILLPFILLGLGYFLVTIPENITWFGVKQNVWFGVGQSVIASALVSIVMLVGLWAERKTAEIDDMSNRVAFQGNLKVLEGYLGQMDTLRGTGIRQMYEDRYSYIRQVYQRHQEAVSRQLDLLGMSLTHFQQDVGNQLLDWVNSRQQLSIRLLLLNPTSPYGRTRDLEEGNPEGHIAEWAIRLTERVLEINHPRIQIRWYNTLPTANVYRLDEVVFVGHYLIGLLSRQTPTLELDVNGTLAQPYLRHFEDLWSPPTSNKDWSFAPTKDDVEKAKKYYASQSKRKNKSEAGHS
jgi:hypothetical protein